MFWTPLTRNFEVEAGRNISVNESAKTNDSIEENTGRQAWSSRIYRIRSYRQIQSSGILFCAAPFRGSSSPCVSHLPPFLHIISLPLKPAT